ncbi:WD repeat-containing protein 25-like [Durio zibethinus]|uniref:WD repeat-containing protein 25-like n=1 Tax=Durio zibethinus TaxID=66656 RepID=A0A6P5ZL86_DURZI|nr:WD repeat-containing protein 25-like [Durio zibethinus]
MDQTICIWNVWSRDQRKAVCLAFTMQLRKMLSGHSRGYLCFLVDITVHDVKWSQQGLFNFKDDQVVGVINFHPENSNLFLSGGSKGRLRLWDVRTGKVRMNTFVVRVQFLMLNSPLMGSNLRLQVMFMGVMSVKILLSFGTSEDRFIKKLTLVLVLGTTHLIPCLWPNQMEIILPFSLQFPPFKLDKFKSYETHGVSGFPIKCNFSLEGKKPVPDSPYDSVYFNNSQSSCLSGFEF